MDLQPLSTEQRWACLETFHCFDYRSNRTVLSDKTETKNAVITLIGTLPPIKGLSPYCSELLRALSKCVKVEFIGFKSIYPELLYPGGTKANDQNYRLPRIENTSIKNLLKWYNPFSWLWAGFRSTGDIVHAQWWAHPLAPVYFVILLIAKLRKKKVIITIHNVLPHEKSFPNTFLNRMILCFGDRFIVHSKENKESLIKLYNNLAEEKISVIPHGILEPVCVKGISKENAREYLKISLDKKVILCFGNIRYYKGLDTMLESMNTIRTEIDALLLIAGQPWDNWKKYEEIIIANHLINNVVKKLGFISPSEVEYFFSACDLVALPYKCFDAQSGIAALTLPFKKPMIVTKVGGLPDFVKDGRAIAKPDNPKDLADKAINILKDEALLLKLARDSTGLLEEFAWDNIAELTLKVYEDTLR